MCESNACGRGSCTWRHGFLEDCDQLHPDARKRDEICSDGNEWNRSCKVRIASTPKNEDEQFSRLTASSRQPLSRGKGRAELPPAERYHALTSQSPPMRSIRTVSHSLPLKHHLLSHLWNKSLFLQNLKQVQALRDRLQL